MNQVKTYVGDCLDVLDFMSSNHVDSIVTDPPYGLSFMGKKWDHGVPSVAIWLECLRVLKPGGYMLAFGGTRTYHRMVAAIEDAGFEVRDQIAWTFGSGFPKSHNGEWGGTALKPAWEPIAVVRKPLIGTVDENWRKYGTGALNIDGCRVGMSADDAAYIAERIGGFNATRSIGGNGTYSGGETMDRAAAYDASKGRWPANLIHDGSEEVLSTFPEAPGQLADASATAPSEKTSRVYGRMRREGEPSSDSPNQGAVGFKMRPGARRIDSGSAARFFYCAKANKNDRGPDNNHPTVKPTDLMRYLCRLVTPSGGIVLDPFMGSGSTGKAAVLEGYRFIGIERESEYAKMAQIRLEHALRDGEL